MGTIQEFNTAHDKADVDFEPSSMHHTLGKSPSQAAPGNHVHDADLSRLATLESDLGVLQGDLDADEVVLADHETRVDVLEALGEKGYFEATANITNVTAETFLFEVGIVVQTGGVYEALINANLSNNAAASTSTLKLKTSVNSGVTTGAQRKSLQKDHRVANKSEGVQLTGRYTHGGAAATVFFAATLAGAVGMSADNAATWGPSSITVRRVA